MDKLEKFILDHKDNFDIPRRPEKGWKGLEGKMVPQKKDWSGIWKVAAILFFISTSGLLVSKFPEQESVQVVDSGNDSIEDFFVKMIDFKREEYMSLASESQRQELLDDILELDLAYINLKISYEQLESEELLEAMLENLQLRVYILNEQIEILKNGSNDNEEVYQSS